MYNITKIESADELLKVCNRNRAEDGEDYPYIGKPQIRIHLKDPTQNFGCIYINKTQSITLIGNDTVEVDESVTVEELLVALAKNANIDIEFD